jgi:acetyl-CoA acetyltransferase
MPLSPAIIGTGATPLERHSHATAAEVALAASLAALAEAGLRPPDIDGYVGCFEAPNPGAAHLDGIDEVSAEYMCGALGLANARVVIDLPQMALGIGLLQSAAAAILAGEARRVLVLRALVHDDRVTYSLTARRTAGGEDQFTLPFGLGKGGGRQALWWRRYLHDHGLAEDAIYPVIANARRNAHNNPRAHWRAAEVPTREAFLQSRYIYAPLRVLDCDTPLTGAVALILARGEAAPDGPARPAYLHGFASRRQDFRAQARHWGASAAEVESWQIYDGFSVLMIDAVERLGLCPAGEGTRYVAETTAARPGFINDFGGSLGEGRMHGMGHLLAAVQAVRRGAARAAADIGMWQLGATALFGREPRRGPGPRPLSRREAAPRHLNAAAGRDDAPR